MHHWIKCSLGAVFLLLFTTIKAQDVQQMIGRIFNENGNPADEVVLFNRTSKSRAKSNLSGNFNLNIHSGDTILITGDRYKQKEVIIPALENQSIYFENFTLEFDREQMLQDFKQQQAENQVVQVSVGEIRLAGRITNIQDEPLKDVNISKLHTYEGSSSSENGLYSMNVNLGDTIVFTFVGHAPQQFVIDSITQGIVLHNVILSTQAVFLNDVTVNAKPKLDLGYQKTGMDSHESTGMTLRQSALMTDKTYFPTFGLSTASYGGVKNSVKKLGSLFGLDGRKQKLEDELTERQRIMREKYLQMLEEQQSDSLKILTD